MEKSTAPLLDSNDQRILAEAALRHITASTARLSGDTFFRALVKELAQALDVCYVIVGRLVLDENGDECSQTLAIWAGNDYLPNMRYSLQHTPCANVADQSMCFHACDIQKEYPLDTLLGDMAAESYLGMPMIANDGTSLGILVALDTRPISEEKRLLALSLLSIFAIRCAAELQHQDREALLEQRVLERSEELRVAQAHLQTQEKMAALGGLVAGVAHEINTPIGVAITAASGLGMFADSLQQKISSEKVSRHELQALAGKMKQAAALVEGNLQRAATLVGNFKKIAVDQHSEQPQHFALADYMQRIISAHGPVLQRAGITVQMDIADDLMMFMPPGLLTQVVSNLLMNSIHHAYPEGKGGTVRIEASKGKDKLLLHYADDGVGIPQDARKRIFEPFFTTKRAMGGSGLGLHIIYNIMQSQGGDITLDAVDAGPGFRVSMYFPQQQD